MPRQKGDGRGRLGGRAPGTPNKEKPLKAFLRQHSTEYFTPSVLFDETLAATFAALQVPVRFKVGDMVSQFDLDVAAMPSTDRVDAELKLLKFHTPQMQSTSVDVTIADANLTLTQRLSRLAEGEDVDAPEDE